ncbi:AAA family ATPase [Sandarakinorhabdus sp.]|uniref:AAA family ATPase n=1 Tax=Sandarakinorhabdus sp. TaxID=1916663 RepID=UPI00286E5E77|nr:AAA family ATPase [Sandarakinorhabdus sp.]
MIWKRKSREEAPETGSVAVEPLDEQLLGDDQSPTDAETQTGEPAVLQPVKTDVPERPVFLDSLWREPAAAPAGRAMPRFMANASDDVETDGTNELARRRLALRDALGASQPVLGRESFAGRHDALSQLINAIEQQRVHVVIYGERGIGKTSLAHVFAETAREARYHVLYGSCGTEANFSEMFRSVAARIPRIFHESVLPNTPEAEKGDNFDVMLPPVFGPRELADVLAGVVGTRVLIILDEYDRVLDPGFRRDVAELVKNLSDRAARVQLVLTGVAQNLDELIGYAPSIRRNIVGLPMRPLGDGEVMDLLRLGEKAADIRYSEASVRMIATMAGGSPYLVRLLGHQAGMAALDAGKAFVSEVHGKSAVERVLTDWNASLPRRVQASLSRDEARAQWPLLIAAAKAGSSADGWFTVDDVYTELKGASAPMAIERELKQFAHPHDLLERSDLGGEIRFRFAYPGVSSLLLMSSAMSRLAG